MSNVGVFIDSENISHNDLPYIMMEIKKFGRIIVSRLYADWSSGVVEKWKQYLVSYALEPVHCAKLPKKNSVDIKMIDDMYDILYFKQTVDVYVIVSNDLDYLTCGRKIKLFGKMLITFGYNHCSEYLKNISDKFINISLLNIGEESQEKEQIELDNVFEGMDEDTVDSKITMVNLILDIMEEERHINFKTLEEKISEKGYNINDLEEKLENLSNNFKIGMVKSRKKVFDISSINSDVHNTIYEQVAAVFQLSDTNEMILPLLKEKIAFLTNKFDQRLWGFNRFKDLVAILFEDKLEIIERGTSVFVQNLMN